MLTITAERLLAPLIQPLPEIVKLWGSQKIMSQIVNSIFIALLMLLINVVLLWTARLIRYLPARLTVPAAPVKPAVIHT